MAKDDDIDVDHEDIEDGVLLEFDIASYPSDYPLGVLHQMWTDKELEIPDFQRSFVWTVQQSSELIESFLLGLPVPQVFFYISDQHKNLILDGQQRILSLVFFFEGYFGFENMQGRRQVFRLQGLHEKSKYNKKTFNELSEVDQRKLKGTVLRAINIRQLSPEGNNTSAYHIFERLNTGGTPLKPQEIRNCVFAGPFVGELKRLNELEVWRKIIARKALSKNQRDVEMILRIFALSWDHADYEKPMKEFLNRSMKANRKGESNKVKAFSAAFPTACQIVADVLPDRPFHIRGPINLAAMDSIMSVLIENIDSVPADFGDRYQILVSNERYKELVFFSTSDKDRVAERFKISRKILFGK